MYGIIKGSITTLTFLEFYEIVNFLDAFYEIVNFLDELVSKCAKIH